MKVSELTGADLDYWIAKAEGLNPTVAKGIPEQPREKWYVRAWAQPAENTLIPFDYEPSKRWDQAGPIIEREHIALVCYEHLHVLTWEAFHNADLNMDGAPVTLSGVGVGSTPLVAAMRAYVASKFGNEVPEETPAQTLNRIRNSSTIKSSHSFFPT